MKTNTISVISVRIRSVFIPTYECDVECVEHGEAVLESVTLAADLDGLANEIPDPKRHAGSFEPAEDVKLVPLDPADPNGKALNISATLDQK
jgi:hypothetical protein